MKWFIAFVHISFIGRKTTHFLYFIFSWISLHIRSISCIQGIIYQSKQLPPPLARESNSFHWFQKTGRWILLPGTPYLAKLFKKKKSIFSSTYLEERSKCWQARINHDLVVVQSQKGKNGIVWSLEPFLLTDLIFIIDRSQTSNFGSISRMCLHAFVYLLWDLGKEIQERLKGLNSRTSGRSFQSIFLCGPKSSSWMLKSSKEAFNVQEAKIQ